ITNIGNLGQSTGNFSVVCEDHSVRTGSLNLLKLPALEEKRKCDYQLLMLHKRPSAGPGLQSPEPAQGFLMV
uniref:Uncharacterized protein n=1 Tax=Anas platyrhynchos TaxID=8839 RepID=A0A8B9SVN5_ANAPL